MTALPAWVGTTPLNGFAFVVPTVPNGYFYEWRSSSTTSPRCLVVASADVIRSLKADGWELARAKGSHHPCRHPTKPGIVTVPHPRKDLPIGTLKSIEKQSGVPLT